MSSPTGVDLRPRGTDHMNIEGRAAFFLVNRLTIDVSGLVFKCSFGVARCAFDAPISAEWHGDL